MLMKSAKEPPPDRAQPDDHDPNLPRGHGAILSARGGHMNQAVGSR
jgi:hypothetical protein